MFGRNRHREDRRYYLLPSMGRSNKRHRRRIFLVALGVGFFLAVLVGALIYLTDRY
jgi:hypothetical protein